MEPTTAQTVREALGEFDDPHMPLVDCVRALAQAARAKKAALLASDPHVHELLVKFVKREKQGRKKYGTDTTRKDLSLQDWLRHAQEEAMDMCVYLETVMGKNTDGYGPAQTIETAQIALKPRCCVKKCKERPFTVRIDRRGRVHTVCLKHSHMALMPEA